MVLAAAFLAIALIGSGCGGGSDNSASTGDNSASTGESSASTAEDSTSSGEGSILGKAEFIGKADAICAEGKKQVEAEYAAYLKKNKISKVSESKESSAETEAHVAEIIETIAIPALRRQIDEIGSLGAPSGEEAQVRAYLAAAEEGIKKGEENPQVMFSSPTEVFANADELADEIGFKVCGQR
jgi:hypothetical protein